MRRVTAMLLAAVALVSVGAGRTARAQIPDSTVVVNPKSAREAEDLGLKLLGVYNAKTGEWVDRAVVRDTLGHETRTSPIGVATLNGLTPVYGVFLLEIRRDGYLPRRIAINENGGEEFLVDLDPLPSGKATELPAVVTTAKSTVMTDLGLHSGLFHRCEMGVTCVGRGDFDLRPTEGIMDQLARLEGIHRNCGKTPFGGPMAAKGTATRDIRANSLDFKSALGDSCGIEMLRAAAEAGSPYCTPTYFINGFEMLGAALPTPDHIEAVEVYRTTDEAPARFRQPPSTAPSCGAVVIWTR